jgi:protein TonB
MKCCFRLLALAFALITPAFAQSKIDPPVPVRTVAPEYPVELKRDGVMGVVVVTCTVDEQGNVIDPAIEKSSNNGFDKPAIEAVKKWKFKPASQNGSPVAKKVSIPIKFVEQG